MLGDEVYESFARTGEHMTAAEMVAYAFARPTKPEVICSLIEWSTEYL